MQKGYLAQEVIDYPPIFMTLSSFVALHTWVYIPPPPTKGNETKRRYSGI